MLDPTHSPTLTSWVTSANGHAEYPIQNLPLGVFEACAEGRIGVAIGDSILDLRAAVRLDLLRRLDERSRSALQEATLNDWMALDAGRRRAIRAAVSALLDADGSARRDAEPHRDRLLHDRASAVMRLPAEVGDYTDFYAGIHHATHVGRVFRPDSPLLPNYRHVPIGYHGRSSSLRVSGTELRRPHGQLGLPSAGDGASTTPLFGASRRLDYELELAMWIGPGNALGEPVPIAQASEHIAGYGLLNDWSARDIQAWEYQPLGPFLGKNFMSSLSPWIVTADALAPFRAPAMTRASGDPMPLPYLHDAHDAREGCIAIELEVSLSSAAMRAAGLAPMRLGLADARSLWWTPAQMLAHHTVGGCNLRPGDLFGSGTISGEVNTAYGSLLEITEGGRKTLTLPGGETRTFLQDGDEVVMRAHCRREGFVSIGFGECRGRVSN